MREGWIIAHSLQNANDQFIWYLSFIEKIHCLDGAWRIAPPLEFYHTFRIFIVFVFVNISCCFFRPVRLLITMELIVDCVR